MQTGGDPDWWARRPGEPTPPPAPRADGRDGTVGGAGDTGDIRGVGAVGAGGTLGGVVFDDDTDATGVPAQGWGGFGGSGSARLAGSWWDAPSPGPEDSRPPFPGQRPAGPEGTGFRPPAAPGGGPLPLPAGFGPADGPPPPVPAWGSDPHPNRNSDPYGVRRGPSANAPLPGGDRSRDASGSLPGDASEGTEGTEYTEDTGGVAASPYRGPATPLAAERARQARIAVVGAVTERWAPEQAGPAPEHGRLDTPVGPATDLWALGALLYRSVQGHAPYPEENGAELVELVRSEPPAFAEECGPLRPVVESLLRQDPAERPDVEELSGWLRSLVRSAPEPEAGAAVVPVPPPAAEGGSRLPVVRRRGELVRKRRSGSAEVVHGRHRHKKAKERAPRALGRTLLLLVLTLMAGAVAYAVLVLPKAGQESVPEPRGAGDTRPTGADRTAAAPAGEPENDPPPSRETRPSAAPSRTSGSEQQTAAPAGDLPAGFALREDPEGFRVAVDSSWQRRPINDSGQIRYSNGDFTLIVVPGRDSAQEGGGDPLVYQRDTQRELQPYRESSWAEASGLRRIQVGRRVMAEGQFSWQDATDRQIFVRNLVLVLDGRYHVVQVIGPDERRDEVTEAYRAAADTYRTTG